MSSFLKRLLAPKPGPTSQGVAIPLRHVREPQEQQPDGTLAATPDADDVIGEDDDVPLLPSDDVDPDRLKVDLEKDLAGVESAYDRKSTIVNKAIQDIGMGRYQWQLFILCGMGWLADNLWMQGLALVLPQLSTEFGVSSTRVRYTTMITFVGLSIGSTFWGIASDIIGRRIAFNTTLFICGAFGSAIAAGPSWIATSLLFGCMGLGVGGNLPVDGALFLEFLPFASNSMLTLLSVWWPVGQLIASIIAWAIIPSHSCDPSLKLCSQNGNEQPCCLPQNNRGWRYFIAVLGVLTLCMFVCRFFLFKLYESPKFLLSRGRNGEAAAVGVVQSIARANGKQTWLTPEILEEFGGDDDDGAKHTIAVIQRDLSKFSLEKLGALFVNWRMGITTVLLWIIWTTIGMGYPLFNAFLPQYLGHVGKDQEPVSTNTVYRNYLITSIVGVPGSIIACYTVDLKYIGRKGTMAISTLVSGIFLYLFPLSNDPGYQTFCSSTEAFFQNIMYGVLYAYTPEVFPAPSRGTGTGIASLLNRIAGLLAPAVAAQTGKVNPAAPILAAGAMYLAAFVAMCLLPIETRGKQSL